MKPIAVAICHTQNLSKKEAKIVQCSICEVDVYFTGYGNDSLMKYHKEGDVKIDDNFRVKPLCKDCLERLGVMFLKTIAEMAMIKGEKNDLMKEVNEIINRKK